MSSTTAMGSICGNCCEEMGLSPKRCTLDPALNACFPSFPILSFCRFFSQAIQLSEVVFHSFLL
jgi:hypothetical protein